MNETLSGSGGDDLRALIHRLNNQLGVILAHAELLEAKAPDAGHRARATQVVSAALQLSETISVAIFTGVGGALIALGIDRGWDAATALALVFAAGAATAVAGLVAGRRVAT